jgi:hypothetical protein
MLVSPCCTDAVPQTVDAVAHACVFLGLPERPAGYGLLPLLPSLLFAAALALAISFFLLALMATSTFACDFVAICSPTSPQRVFMGKGLVGCWLIEGSERYIALSCVFNWHSSHEERVPSGFVCFKVFRVGIVRSRQEQALCTICTFEYKRLQHERGMCAPGTYIISKAQW